MSRPESEIRITNKMCKVFSGLDNIRLPEMSGYEATRKIREFNSSVIIIAQTAYGLSGDREKAIDAGCNDYISKPIKNDVLTGQILKYFS